LEDFQCEFGETANCAHDCQDQGSKAMNSGQYSRLSLICGIRVPLLIESMQNCIDLKNAVLWCKIFPMDELALIRSAQHGDLEAFNRLVLAYQDALYNTALRILGDEDLAADATQDAFLSAFRGLNGFRGGSFRAWLLRTVTNACYDELRRRRRRPTTPLEPVNDEQEEVESPRWMADPDASPERELDQAELEHAIQHCLERLPAEFRAVVVLADIQGLDYSEVARAVRTPLGTVKSRLARARLRLRECLQGFRELLPAAFRLEEESGV
jgi:RNA polymerase sigma-70 factor (ECF subfamily)